jgi:serine protease AprX
VRSAMAVTTRFTGAEAAWSGAIQSLGKVNGSGIGVAVIDSGIANHPALQHRVIASFDFTDVNGHGEDFYGHGTHIAGIIAARGFNNSAEGAASGMAPAAHLINLKVLGADGSGEAANVIEAIDFATRFRTELGIRVINLSLGAAPTQSYKDDPICLAVERAVKAGIVVVASAGNYGQTPDGKLVYGSITSPGISPYAITVGATRTQGTLDPSDDEVAPWSSKGPTMIDHIVKPDLVAPGSKIISTAAAGSNLVATLQDRFVDGPGARDYVSMSGTSMSAAVVSGAAALILDGQTALAPVQVKVALQASADFMVNAGLLASGAGRMDLIDLDALPNLPLNEGEETAFSFSVPGADGTSAQIIVWGDIIVWGNEVTWGDIIVWGNRATATDIIVWGNASKSDDIIVWGNSKDIIVWGNGSIAQDIIVWGNATSAQDIIVWGNSADDIIVWGNYAAEIIVWGNSNDIIVWGNAADIIVWGN